MEFRKRGLAAVEIAGRERRPYIDPLPVARRPLQLAVFDGKKSSAAAVAAKFVRANPGATLPEAVDWPVLIFITGLPKVVFTCVFDA